ncbi:MAG: PEP-CTERM sorting domain-containing protein [Planctomycetota bacterium]
MFCCRLLIVGLMLCSLGGSAAAELLFFDQPVVFQNPEFQAVSDSGFGLTTVGTLGNPALPGGFAVDESAGKVFILTDLVGVQSMNLDGTGLTTLSTTQTGPFNTFGRNGLAIDPVSQKVFWTAGNTAIRSIDYDGSNETEIVAASGFSTISAIAVNPIDSHVFFARGNAEILRVDSDGSNQTTIVPLLFGGVNNVWDLEVDLLNDHIYWSENRSSGEIVRADLDGSNITQVLATSRPLGIALNPTDQELYWTSGTSGNTRIFTTDFLGGSTTEIFGPFSANGNFGIEHTNLTLAVPEPSSLAFLMVAGFTLGLSRKRRHTRV